MKIGQPACPNKTFKVDCDELKYYSSDDPWGASILVRYDLLGNIGSSRRNVPIGVLIEHFNGVNRWC